MTWPLAFSFVFFVVPARPRGGKGLGRWWCTPTSKFPVRRNPAVRTGGIAFVWGRCQAVLSHQKRAPDISMRPCRCGGAPQVTGSKLQAVDPTASRSCPAQGLPRRQR